MFGRLSITRLEGEGRGLTRFRPRPIYRAALSIAFLMAATGARGQSDLLSPPSIRNIFSAGRGVSALALSPDGRWGAVGATNGEIGIFGVTPQSGLRWIARQKKRIEALAFNRDGSILASAGDAGSITLIRLPDGAQSEIQGSKRKIFALAFSPRGRLLASGGEGQNVIMWDPGLGVELYQIASDRRKPVEFLSFNPTGTTLLAVDSAGLVSEWDVKNRSLVRQYQSAGRTVYCAATSPSGEYLALGTESAALQKGAFGAPEANSSTASAGAARPGTPRVFNNRSVLAPDSEINPGELVRRDGIQVYDLNTGSVGKAIDVESGEVSSISVSADNRYVAVTRRRQTDGLLSIYDIQHGTDVLSLPTPRDTFAVSFSADGQWLASATDDGTVTLYAFNGIRPGGEVGDIIGMKFVVTSSKGGSIIPANANLTIGVLDFEARGVDEATTQAIADMLRTQIGQNSSVQLVERSRLDQVIREQNFQASYRVDPSTAVKLGRVVGAQKIIRGSVSRVGTSLTIHAEMVDVQTGRIDGSCDVLCQRCAAQDLPEAVARLKPALVADSR